MDIVKCMVKVNRARSTLRALSATGRDISLKDGVVDTMPRGVGDHVNIVFFRPGPEFYEKGNLSCAALDAEYKRLGLRPDPQALIDYNAANPTSADKQWNACQWKREGGDFCYVAFDNWIGKRGATVARCSGDWSIGWVFAGVPEESLTSAT